MLIAITLAETGGAQSYVAHLLPAITKHFDVTVAAHGPGPLRDVASRAGTSFVPLNHVRRALNPFRDALGVVELYRLLRSVRPDVVHLNSSKVGILGYAYGVAANADPNREAAAAALVECRASEENQLETAIQGGYVPALTSAQDAFVAEVPAAKAFVDALPGGFNSASLGTDWQALQQEYVDALQNATVNGVSAEEALQQASQG